MIKPLTQKDSVEISVESRNNTHIAKNNADEERELLQLTQLKTYAIHKITLM